MTSTPVHTCCSGRPFQSVAGKRLPRTDWMVWPAASPSVTTRTAPGRRVKAEEGLPWGLVDEVVPLADLRAAALRLATEIAENAPLAIIATRKTLRGDLAPAVRAQTNHEHAQQTILRATEDFAEGVRAVQERRAGVFTGR